MSLPHAKLLLWPCTLQNLVLKLLSSLPQLLVLHWSDETYWISSHLSHVSISCPVSLSGESYSRAQLQYSFSLFTQSTFNMWLSSKQWLNIVVVAWYLQNCSYPSNLMGQTVHYNAKAGGPLPHNSFLFLLMHPKYTTHKYTICIVS